MTLSWLFYLFEIHVCSFIDVFNGCSLAQLRGDVHTQFVMQNVKIMFSVQLTHPPTPEKVSCDQIFFFCCKNILYRYQKETEQLQKVYLL